MHPRSWERFARVPPRVSLLLIILCFPNLALRADTDAFREKRTPEAPGRFTFARVQYQSEGGYGESWYNYDGRTWQRWETDYPEADENFLLRLSELTTIDPNPKPVSVKLTDPKLFQYPLLYMCDPGWMVLTREEKDKLREYFKRGGFLWIDDFWGQGEWMNLEANIRDVFPNLRWREIGKDHAILQSPFKLEGCPMVPAVDFAMQGWTHDPPYIHREPAEPVDEVHFRGLFAEDGRLLAVATHNTDLGDGFEREAGNEWYFEKYSTLSYALGVNIVVYALTH